MDKILGSKGVRYRGVLLYYEYTVAKQNGGGGEWVELFITLTWRMGEPTYGLLLSLVSLVPRPFLCGRGEKGGKEVSGE